MPPKSAFSSHSTPKSHHPSQAAHFHTNKRQAPKQAPTASERLKRLFTSLCAQIDGGHFGNAVKTCDKILRIDPKDKDALQTKLFVLLQTEQYDAALSLIGTVDSDSEYTFERTYSLYRVQHEEDAVEGLKALKEKDDVGDERAVLHLEAQLSYRRGSYQTAFELYNQLLDTAEPQSEEHSDILTNLTASQKHLEFINTGFLRALDALPTSVTINIETNPPPVHPATSSVVNAAIAHTSLPAAIVDDQIQPVKKVRKSRVPKGIIPGVTPPPDPERWLKKSERSTFGQGRKRRGGGGAGGGTQGSTVEAGPGGSGGASGSSHNVRSGGGRGKKKK